jgi:hypothetical protein
LIQTKDFNSETLINQSLSEKTLSIPDRMLNYLKDRQKKFLNKTEDNYLSLEELSSLIRKDPILPDYLKKRIVLNYALKDLFAQNSETQTNKAFLSPVIYIEANKIFCKIYVMAPLESNSQEEVNFKNTCFQQSKDAINLLVSKKIISSKSLNDKNYLYSLIRENRIDDKYFYPYEHCLEEELRSLSKRAFTPYQYLSIDSFIKDVISFGKNNKKLIEISQEYHICSTDIYLNDEGTIDREPEIYYHFFSQLSSLEKVLKNDFYLLTNSFGMRMISQEIEIYTSKYNQEISKNPELELSRASHLTDIISSFPSESILPEKEKKFIRSLRISADILKKITNLLPIYSQKRYEILLNSCINRFKNDIIYHSSEKKVLFTVFLKDIISFAYPTSETQKFTIEKELRKIVLQEFGCYEVLCENDEKLLYLVDPGYIHRVIVSLCINGKVDESLRTQYFIASNIYKQLLSKKKPINFKINSLELKEIEEKLPSLEKQIIKLNNIRITINFLFSLYTFLILFSSISYLLFLKFFYLLPARELLLLPLGIILSKSIHILFSLKPKK